MNQYIQIVILEGETSEKAEKWNICTGGLGPITRDEADAMASILRRAMSGIQEITRKAR